MVKKLITGVLRFVIVLQVLTKATGETLRFREHVARAIPVTDQRLDVTPLWSISPSSRVRCLTRCASMGDCAAFNFRSDGVCDLLPDFLCEDSASLVPATGYTYYDVENSTKDIEVNYGSYGCLHQGRCSPKCPSGCVWSNQFTVTPGRYVVGFTKETLMYVTEEECKQHCLDATSHLCKSADYVIADQKCYLSNINRDERPELYYSSSTYTYIHRLCL